MLKNFVVFACVLVAANAVSKEFMEKMMSKMMDVGQKCMVETKASSDDIAKLLAHQIPDTNEGKCMIFCFHKAFGVQTPDGALSLEGAIASLDPIKADDMELYEKVKSVFETCIPKTAVDADPCITAATLGECASDVGKSLGISPDMFEV
ncbi:unnamed protein product [Brassicogethes aeneus]|uniref:Uncharacterized protein n=1 Tax=Brassicogethes aeneus TaxID=1431903 RepID=A0A9P0BGK1_BRAAE|nr:unnamed protein product [Brassicogethes aeneus]